MFTSKFTIFVKVMLAMIWLFCIANLSTKLPALADAISKDVESVENDRRANELPEAFEEKGCFHKCENVCRFYEIIVDAAGRHEVEAALVMAIIHAESRYNPKAVSHRGAQGLMQLMPGTAEALGVRDSFDPQQNVDAGVRYLKRLLRRFDGDLELALAAYNAGTRRVLQYKGVPPFPETLEYIRKVWSWYQGYKQQQEVSKP